MIEAAVVESGGTSTPGAGPDPAPEPAPNPEPDQAPDPGEDNARAAFVFALDPAGIGGVVLRAQPGPARDRWLTMVRAMISGPMRKVPLGITEDRLLGGLDLPATLAAGAPRRRSGALAEADGGALILAMAERVSPGTAGRIAQALDSGATGTDPARFGIVLLDEGIDDERASAALLDRAALHIDLAALAHLDPPDDDTLAAARARLPGIQADDADIAALCTTAAALGIESIRPPLLALAVARAAAALDGRDRLAAQDLALAARLALAPRATRLPVSEPPAPEAEQEPEPPPPSDLEASKPDAADPKERPPEDRDRTTPPQDGPLADQVLEAARAAIPPGLLALLQQAGPRARTPGKSGSPVRGARGRPLNTRPGLPRDGLRLNLIETLRAAAPWQRLRRSEDNAADAPTRLRIRRDDLRVTRRQQRAETTTIFLVDASGSLALNRLAEAKGAVELLLADCYVRRDQVAVIAFRGQQAQLLLPPTRSLVRAKRSLSGLPGGGGTPLATAIEAGLQLADAVRRRGGTPTLVLLTDGQANIGRDGRGGRKQAAEDATQAARRLRAAGHAALLIDTSQRPNSASRALAEAMSGRYLALPQADASSVSRSVKALLA